MLDNWIKKTRSFRYVIFPIYMQSHWTVLVQDREEGTWRFYNSFRPRRGRDCHFEPAKKLKKIVEEYEERNSNGLVSTQDFREIVSVRSSPQLISGSLDCGVIVIYIMQRVLWDKEIESNLPNDECKKIRAKNLHEFLSDEELYSWTQEANKE
ncbi:uncharacterized protein LOC131298146 [Rhododendron vialii]|uniref:uncharacterized protein LOC131298146 n=1 Tax=Rhododendron vialii TaxID=182163 RepID=UPI00265FD042|nr:uncharacterized protein LOC131298146 [Rhododendron vialii]